MLPHQKDPKHIACSRCRDRKVRCDGQKPGCRRCQRLGQECQYVRSKKSQDKGEWVQHLTTFRSQPGKTSQLASNRRQPPQAPHLLRPKPTVEVSDADSVVPYSRSPSPYLGYAVSPPTSSTSSYGTNKSIVVDTEDSFGSPDNMDAWMPPAPSSSLSIEGHLLDPQLFTFSSAENWRNTNYMSGLITTDGGGIEMCDEQMYAVCALDPPLYYSPPPYPIAITTTGVPQWQPQSTNAFPPSQSPSQMPESSTRSRGPTL